MNAVKRVEIVVGSRHARAVIELLSDVGVEGWTVLKGASGAGNRGVQFADEPTVGGSNTWILTACEEATFDALRERLRELLKRVGGVCLVSEAMWLRH